MPVPEPFLVSDAMEAPQLNARRATLDDLAGLQALWQRCGLPWEQLERYLTEFQVVPLDDGTFVGAMGLLVEGHEALMHTEAIPADQGEPDEIRAALWRRVQIVARNQGVVRLWTQEDAPYWGASGYGVPDPKSRGEAKAGFLSDDPDWRMYQLVDPDRAAKMVQEQMAIWEATRSQESDDLQETVRRIRTIAFVVTGLIIAVLFGLVMYVFAKRPDMIQRLLHR